MALSRANKLAAAAVLEAATELETESELIEYAATVVRYLAYRSVEDDRRARSGLEVNDLLAKVMQMGAERRSARKLTK